MDTHTPVEGTFDWFLERLDVALWKSRTPGKRDAMTNCPMHGGSDSLHVTENEDGSVVTHCFNCSGADVAGRVAEELAGPDGGGIPLKSKSGRREVGRERYDILDADGKLCAVHTRINFDDGTKTYLWPKGTKPATLPLYGSEDLKGYDRSEPLLVVEGERCRDRAVEAGYQAVALVAGASIEPDPEVLKVLTGWRLILWPDNDDPGRAIMSYVAKQALDTAVEVRIVAWPDAPPKGDLVDYLDAGHTLDETDAVLRGADVVSPEPDGWGNGKGKDAMDILAATYPDSVFVVDGLVPEGGTILASYPKIGKSAMCYQLAVALGIGGEFLGRRVKQRPVLYYALEDGEKRSQTRLARAVKGHRLTRGAIEMRWVAPQLGKGLEQEIAAWLDAHPDGLVIIDTFQKVRPETKGNKNAYEHDVASFTLIQDLVRKRPGASVILVLHLKKSRDDDFLVRVSGSLGGPGTTDTTLVLDRPRHSDNGTLEATGRDVGEVELAVTYHDLLWSYDADRIPGASPERQQVFDVIADLQPVWPKQIAEEINDRGGDQTRTSVQHICKKLEADQWIVWTQRGWTPAGPRLVLKSEQSPNSDHSDHSRTTPITRDHSNGPKAAMSDRSDRSDRSDQSDQSDRSDQSNSRSNPSNRGTSK